MSGALRWRGGPADPDRPVLRRDRVLRVGRPARPAHRRGHAQRRAHDHPASPDAGAPGRGRAHRCRGARTRSGGPRRRRPRARGSGCAGARAARSRRRPRPGCAASSRPTSTSGGSPGHRKVSTPASRRCGGATSTGSATTRPRSTRCAATTPCWSAARSTSRRWTAPPRSLLGLHDFAAFCRRREGATTVRTLLDHRWDRAPDGTVEATVVADAFCHSMVRGPRRGGRARGRGSPGAGRARRRCSRAGSRLPGAGDAAARALARGGRLPAGRASSPRAPRSPGATGAARLRDASGPRLPAGPHGGGAWCTGARGQLRAATREVGRCRPRTTTAGRARSADRCG